MRPALATLVTISSRGLGQGENYERRTQAPVLIGEQRRCGGSDDGAVPAGCGGDELAAIYGVGDGGSAVAGTSLIAPQAISGFGVHGEKLAFGIAGEDQVAGGGEHRREQ